MWPLSTLAQLTIFRTLQVVGMAVFLGASSMLIYRMAKADSAAATSCEPTSKAVLQTLEDGTCKVFIKMYTTQATITLSGGECLMAMSAAGKYLDTESLSSPLGTGE